MTLQTAPATAGIMVPHPPIILPKVGRGEEKKIADVDAAYRHAVKTIADSKPDTVVIISPHAPAYADYIQVASPQKLYGSMAAFNDPHDAFAVENDTVLAEAIDKIARDENFPMGTLGSQDGRLDHGTMVPLWYLEQEMDHPRILRVSIGGLSHLDHYRAGMIIAKAARVLGRKISIVASGDLSHCQKADTHYGFKPCGPRYDARLMQEMGEGDFLDLIETSEQEAQDAMSCGHPSFSIMAGVFDGYKPVSKATAHSAEFGVGYGVAEYTDLQPDDSRHFYQTARQEKERRRQQAREKEDAYVRLARETIESFVRDHAIPALPQGLPAPLYDSQAGAFVSLHKNGTLRGCIGTTSPTQKNLGLEIMANAVSACSKDPRFYPVQPDELDDLEISVDVLDEPEPCTVEDLDVKKYGVIVAKDNKRGLLLPNLDGVNTVEEQLAIAKQKAGIPVMDQDVLLERFEVTRHV